MVVFLVRELTRNLPTPTEVEFHCRCIRLNNSESARLVTTGSYLGFRASKQSASDAASPVLVKYPEVTDPVPTCQCNADNLGLTDSHPRQRPVIFFQREGHRIRSEELGKGLICYRSYQLSHFVMLVGLRVSDNRLNRHRRILA